MKVQDLFEAIKYTIPDFGEEWEEALRYPELQHLSKNEWITLAKSGQTWKPSAEELSSIKNSTATDSKTAREEFTKLEVDKRVRFSQALQSGELEMPIVIRRAHELSLLGGNTRLTGVVSKGLQPTVWLVDVRHEAQ